MHSKLASDWELFVTLRKRENKRNFQTGSSRDAPAAASLWRKEHGSKAAWQQQLPRCDWPRGRGGRVALRHYSVALALNRLRNSL
jgi:hypothetical protein